MSNWKELPIIKRNDGTFVITNNGYPYHVIPGDSLFSKVIEFAEENSTQVSSELEIPPPSDKDLDKKRILEIQARLAEIDIESARPLRALAAGSGTDFDREKLSKLDAEVRTLRKERAFLSEKSTDTTKGSLDVF